MPDDDRTAVDVDVLIIGAGLSGIGAGYHLQAACPNKSYEIIEARDTMGGTWDLFRYPGIRSDSDMYTLGYIFRPWTDPKAIADGPSILAYIKDTAAMYGIDKKIRYGHKVIGARWSTKNARWTVDLLNVKTNETLTKTCRFLYACAGYYDYDGGYTPEFTGRERFRGPIVHPQQWTDDINYDGKRVVVIGSGATAVTLVPEMAKRAKHVVMLQRSPTYIITRPTQDKIADILRKYLPAESAYAMSRWKNVLMSMGFYMYCRAYPDTAKKLLVREAKRQLRKAGDANVDHFTPSYYPWDQRICLVPDSDLFKVIQDGSASVITDHIDTFTEKGILLKSGREIEADLIVTATGLKIKFIGGAQIEVDGKRMTAGDTMIYKGMMCSDVPNFAFAIGYTNASWTLKCDLASAYVCRLLNYMDKHGHLECRPKRTPDVQEQPLMDFTSGYVQRALADLPRQGSVLPWKLYQNYIRDRWMFNRGRLDDAVEFS
jgi:monooxygenase